MSGRLQGRVALVTGGSRGIGRATCLALAKEGAAVCVNYRKAESEAERVVREVKGLGSDGYAVKADVAQVAQVNGMVQRALKKFGKIDVLVNNAGVIHTGEFMDLADSDFEDMISVNVRGVVNCTKAVARGMI